MNDQDITNKFNHIDKELKETEDILQKFNRKISDIDDEIYDVKTEDRVDSDHPMGKHTEAIKYYILKDNLFNYLAIFLPIAIVVSNTVGYYKYDSSDEIKLLKNQNTQLTQELRITKGLVEEQVKHYDINSDGNQDYIFKNGDVYVYNPKKENYLETTLHKIEEKQKSELDKLELNEKNIDRNIDSLFYEKQLLIREKTKLDSVYSTLKK